MTQVQYLWYIINERGVHVDPTKIQVIQDWPTPTTLTGLCSFLCLVNLYRKFVLGFSRITWPLSQVTKGRVKENFFWSESQQNVFFELKHHLCFAPILTLPYLQQPFKIEINASNYVIGVVLTQQGNSVDITVRPFQIWFDSIQLMTKRCILLFRPTNNEIITLCGRKQSSTQTTDPCSSYRHKGSCRVVTIINAPHICNSSI